MTARVVHAEWLAGARALHIVHLRKQRDSARRAAEKAETEVARLGKALTATRALRDEAETERDEWSAEAARLRDWGDAQARAANSSDKTVERLVGERDEAVRLLKVANAEAAGGSHD
jgi:chromosome segregation ATPase